MSVMERLLPARPDNETRGPVFTWYVFVVLATISFGRSCIHLFADDAGLNSIATLVVFDAPAGGPDPNRAVYLFGSLWGLHQVLLASLYLLVAFRYRSLVPLMYLTLVVEWGARLGIVAALHPLGADYFRETPPGVSGALPMLGLASAMFVLSLRSRGTDPRASEPRVGGR